MSDLANRKWEISLKGFNLLASSLQGVWFSLFLQCHIIPVRMSSWGHTCLQSVGHYEMKKYMFGFTESKITLSGTAEA